MHLDIVARNFELTDAIDGYVQRRIGFALSSRFEQIKEIRVRLQDINGPRGGIDKCCPIQIRLPRMRDIVIEDIEANLYVAIDRATERAARTVNRRLSRQFYKNRKLFIPGKRATDLTIDDQYI